MNIFNLNESESNFFDDLLDGVPVEAKNHEETITYYGKSRREAKALSESITREIEKYQAKLKTLDNVINNCDMNISFAMQYMDIKSYNDGIGKINLQKSHPSLVIDDTFNINSLEKRYYIVTDPQTKLLKRDIISSIESGELVMDGLSVERREHLRFY
ncbi:MAG: siphovirus Gp157 family protein [Rickettsiales bacterium]